MRDRLSQRAREPRTASCRLRIFVYEHVLRHLTHELHSVGSFFGWSDVHNASCLEAPCSYDSFSAANVRAFTSEIPMYQRIMSQCPRATRPEDADLFIVPFMFGTMMTLGWGLRAIGEAAGRRGGSGSGERWHPLVARQLLHVDAYRHAHALMARAAREIPSRLTHLRDATAHKHLFFFSCDVEYISDYGVGAMQKSLILHLGDDAYRHRYSNSIRHPRIDASQAHCLRCPFESTCVAL